MNKEKESFVIEEDMSMAAEMGIQENSWKIITSS